MCLSQLVKEETCSRDLMREEGQIFSFFFFGFFFFGFSVWLMGSRGPPKGGLNNCDSS